MNKQRKPPVLWGFDEEHRNNVNIDKFRESVRETKNTTIDNARQTKKVIDTTIEKIKNDPVKQREKIELEKMSQQIQKNIDELNGKNGSKQAYEELSNFNIDAIKVILLGFGIMLLIK